jgi:hypothetical protein
MGSHVFAWAGLDHNPPTLHLPPTMIGMRGVHYHAQLLVGMGSCELFA